MTRVQTSKIVPAAQDKIFSVITDFDNLPSRFPNRYRSLKVIERSENSVTVEEDVTVAGREIHQITKHTFEPKRFLRSEVIDGDTKGTIVEITLDPEEASRSTNTKVSVDADLKLGKLGSVLGVFAKGKIKGGLEHMIEEFGNVV
ncbi:MAG: SRPBCC family protein [Thermoproteota archaeon]|jgi:ribosome-associated toxin RatA of RatAB toxin-antitoxin module|nr:SRPBCC family protein [Thermoproteota archaeon]MDQ5842845.1 SRPBCC family protein [Thermoproteota archaeon]